MPPKKALRQVAKDRESLALANPVGSARPSAVARDQHAPTAKTLRLSATIKVGSETRPSSKYQPSAHTRLID